ncbi:MAG: YqgE/AlgH family protein [Alphaproteobacteria bacterium]|nr:YqgE/AlgH family protein [Alphaproteobacteria bacterium]
MPHLLKDFHLDGQMLIAMPTMEDPQFERSVIYLCAHSEVGAMGIIINRTVKNISLPELLKKLKLFPSKSNITLPKEMECKAVHIGGPIEQERGFVIHSPDYHAENETVSINDQIHLTATLDILKKIIEGTGPEQFLLALGYTGWAPGQLENEIHGNNWLNCPVNSQILFTSDLSKRYDMALASIGVNPLHLVSEIGHS